MKEVERSRRRMSWGRRRGRSRRRRKSLVAASRPESCNERELFRWEGGGTAITG